MQTFLKETFKIFLRKAIKKRLKKQNASKEDQKATADLIDVI